jgi:hypothetical protein
MGKERTDDARERETRMTKTVDETRVRGRTTHRVLILVAAAGLAVDSYVHWHLAAGYDVVEGTGTPHITQGDLFRIESVLALIAMLVLLLIRNRLAALFAFLVAAGGLGAVLLYAYVDVGGFGPVPDMYDPIWYTEKTISAVAEGVAALAALGLVLLLPGPLYGGSRDASG